MTPEIRKNLLGLINEESYQPLRKEELATIFDIHSSEMPLFYNFISELEEEGHINITKKEKIVSPESVGNFVGKFISHKKGFGFVESDGENEQDLFIPAGDVNGAMHNDRVIAEVVVPAQDDKRAEGKIVKIVKREVDTVVGVFEPSKAFGFVVPDNKKFNKDIYVPKRFFSGARAQDKVVCKITVWPEEGKKPEGKIIEVLGHKGDRGVEIDSIIREHGLPEEFPKKVVFEAESVAVEIPKEEISRRSDLRDLKIYNRW